MHMRMCLHVSVHNTMCSAGPHVAAGTALKQIGKGGGGGGLIVAGLQAACETHIQGVLGHPPQKIVN